MPPSARAWTPDSDWSADFAPVRARVSRQTLIPRRIRAALWVVMPRAWTSWAYSESPSRCDISGSRYDLQGRSQQESEEGYSVSCPGLPGCWSQGDTEEEALDNIRDAIEPYLETVDEMSSGGDVREVEVAA